MQTDINRRLYRKRQIGAHYARRSALQTAEEAIFARLACDLAGARILDLGVGGGRTTPFLLQLSSNYVGVEYSDEMVARCRQRFPAVRFELADARDLSLFPASSFDFVFFSSNGIDTATHSDRLDMFSGLRRLLEPGGLFVFSSHNRNFPIPKPWELGHFDVNPVRNPVTFAKRLASYPVGMANYVRHARNSEVTDDYVIELDSAHRYSLVHYRITLAAQKRQLERAGFRLIEAVGLDGRPVSLDQSATAGDPWFHYICRSDCS
jgi:SAM-dependent methyltransferase